MATSDIITRSRHVFPLHPRLSLIDATCNLDQSCKEECYKEEFAQFLPRTSATRNFGVILGFITSFNKNGAIDWITHSDEYNSKYSKL